jgi:hypothetical protein
MKIFTKLALTLLLCFTQNILAQTKLPECKGEDSLKWTNCLGTLNFISGASYSGGFKNGKPNGMGTLKASNGDVYVGQYANGKENGQGTYTYLNGDKYIGQFKDAEFHGQGSYIFASGEKYVGQYKNDKRDGQGVLTLKAGGSYSGQWKDNLMHGRGTYIDENGVKLVGIWAEGKLIQDESPKPPPPKPISLSCVHEGGRMAGLEVQYFIDEQDNSVIASRGGKPSNVVVAPTLIIFNQDTASVSINRITGKFTLVLGSIISSGTCQLLDQAKPKF